MITRLVHSAPVVARRGAGALRHSIIEGMYFMPHPLDWWAVGGYDEVIRQTGWNRARARREVKKAIKAQGWNPIGHQGYEALRQRLVRGDHLDHELV